MVRALTDAELREYAERGMEHFGKPSAAPPQVRNAEALVAISEHRPLRWRGHHYHVPPLSFSAGMRLLVLSQILATRHRARVRQALYNARSVLHGCVRTPRGRKPWRNPFRKLTQNDARSIINQLLYVPDETPVHTSKQQGAIDLLDGFMEFCRVFPALVGPDGLPVSWAHYQHGVRQLSRVAARETLRSTQAVRIGQWHSKTSFEAFEREQSAIAGWN